MKFQLPDITYPLAINTIGKMLAMGQEIHITCGTYGCDHDGRLNLVQLARRLDKPGRPGLDQPTGRDALLRHVYCPQCRRAGRPDRQLHFVVVNPEAHSAWPRERELERQGIQRARAG